MLFKIEFNTDEEKHKLLEANKDKYLIEIQYLLNGTKILVFSDIKTSEIIQKEHDDKISILNEQNSKLLLDKAKNEIQINTLNKNLANVTLEVAKMKGGM